MSYNRGKKRNKKRNKMFVPKNQQYGMMVKHQQKKNSIQKKVDSLFGNFEVDLEKLFFSKGWNEFDLQKRTKLFNEGEKEWEKKFEIMMNNKEKINKLFHELNYSPSLLGQGKQIYNNLVTLNFYNPYELYGNKTKSWFNDFYDWVSELEIPKVFKGNNGVKLLFRVMEKSEFLNQLENGVQSLSWSPDITNLSMWIRKHFLSKPNSENDKMMIVCGMFHQEQIILKKSDNNLSVSKEEDEYWIRKGEKPLQTFHLGEYTWEEFIKPYNEEVILKKLDEYRNLFSNTNGFVGDKTECMKILNETSNDNKHIISHRLFGTEVEKLTRKVMKSSLVNNERKRNNIGFVNGVEKTMNHLLDVTEQIMEIKRENNMEYNPTL